MEERENRSALWPFWIVLASSLALPVTALGVAPTAARVYARWNVPLDSVASLSVRMHFFVGTVWIVLPILAFGLAWSYRRPAGLVALLSVPPWIPYADPRTRVFRARASAVLTFMLALPGWLYAQA